MTDLDVTPCTSTHSGHNISSGSQNFLGIQITSGNSLIGADLSALQVALGKEGTGDTGNVTATHQRGSTITPATNVIPYSSVSIWSLPNDMFTFNFNVTIEENDYFWITSDNLTNRMGVDYYATCPNYTGFDSKKKATDGTIASLAGQLRSVWTTGAISGSTLLFPPQVAYI